MAIKNILFALTTYPEPTSDSAIQNAVAFAAIAKSHITAVACETHIQMPGHIQFVPSSIINVSGMIAAETHKSRENAKRLLAEFERTAKKFGVAYELASEKGATAEVPSMLVQYSRLHDITIAPVSESTDPWYAEAIIFGSGKPTLVIPERKHERPISVDTVAVAWDFSRNAARAISDAMPILELSKTVRIVTVLNEKALDKTHSATELAKTLSRHGLSISLDEVDSQGRSIGAVLESHIATCNADMLVMGAYGHSRFREFVLGGATRSMLTKPPVPILFSH